LLIILHIGYSILIKEH